MVLHHWLVLCDLCPFSLFMVFLLVPGRLRRQELLILVGHISLVVRVYVRFFLNLGGVNQRFQCIDLKLF